MLCVLVGTSVASFEDDFIVGSNWNEKFQKYRSEGKSLLFQTFVVVVNVAHVPVYTRQFSLKMGWITFQMLKSTVAYSKFDSNTSVKFRKQCMFLHVPAPWEQLLIWLNLHWVGIDVGLLLFKTSYIHMVHTLIYFTMLSVVSMLSSANSPIPEAEKPMSETAFRHF